MRMNDHSGNIFTQFFAWVGTLAAALGFTTQDMVYMFFGAVGLLISLISYVNGRIDARRKRKEDEKRTAMIRDYLDGIGDKPIAERPAAVSVVADALTKAGE
ncbi:hypothetical protein QE63_001553 [Salmonella enterica subsp. enterica]|nr:hypothetical protein [Salmonella enterica subsp. enterica serovar Richmond]EBU9249714.1 hypothetical protein [Salmonella enterica subsp. enterica serovar Oslo]EBV2473080.1 hypothetical protein [Salmonella enterica subsp. enterica serovar Potsdam]EDT8805414.1 hypothetical protein [Salmonella enterica subsp. enterica]EEN4862538.1 hypothetical protein [Salmonella enterica]HDP0196492.1 hypothetical protein [Salmonella enterica subsp. enterica serovar Concord]